jgi:hypothetical protein
LFVNTRKENVVKVSSTWKDGLPDDPLERAQIEQILKTSGLTSTYSSIKRLHDGDGAAAEEEIERIREEERGAITGAAQPQAEGMPQKAELYKAQAERGERGTGDDRG